MVEEAAAGAAHEAGHTVSILVAKILVRSARSRRSLGSLESESQVLARAKVGATPESHAHCLGRHLGLPSPSFPIVPIYLGCLRGCSGTDPY